MFEVTRYESDGSANSVGLCRRSVFTRPDPTRFIVKNVGATYQVARKSPQFILVFSNTAPDEKMSAPQPPCGRAWTQPAGTNLREGTGRLAGRANPCADGLMNRNCRVIDEIPIPFNA